MYVIHSGVRKRSTRLHRQQRKAGTRPKFVQKFGGTEITVRRARPVRVTEEALLRHLVALKKAEAEGRIEVRTLTGLRVDLSTLTVAGAPPVAPPRPHPPIDSAERDIPAGEHMRPQHGTAAQTESSSLPSVLQDDLPDGWDGGDLEEASDDSFTSPVTEQGKVEPPKPKKSKK